MLLAGVDCGLPLNPPTIPLIPPLVPAHRHLWLPDFWSCRGSRRAPVLPLRGRGCGRCPSLHHPECAHLLSHLALLWAVSPFPTLSRAPGSQHDTWPCMEPVMELKPTEKNVSRMPSPHTHARSIGSRMFCKPCKDLQSRSFSELLYEPSQPFEYSKLSSYKGNNGIHIHMERPSLS